MDVLKHTLFLNDSWELTPGVLYLRAHFAHFAALPTTTPEHSHRVDPGMVRKGAGMPHAYVSVLKWSNDTINITCNDGTPTRRAGVLRRASTPVGANAYSTMLTRWTTGRRFARAQRTAVISPVVAVRTFSCTRRSWALASTTAKAISTALLLTSAAVVVGTLSVAHWRVRNASWRACWAR